MLSGHRSAGRRRGGKSRAARIAVPLAIPMALGLTLGIVLAVSGGNTTKIDQSALGASASPSGQRFRVGEPVGDVDDGRRGLDDQRELRHHRPGEPAVGAGTGDPLPAHRPGRDVAGAVGVRDDQRYRPGAFAQATILDPATGKLSVYDPLVITKGSTPAVQPSVPTIPADAIVTVDFGFNGTGLFQVGATPNALSQGQLHERLPGSIFGQVSFCNGANFFNAAFQDEREGKLKVPCGASAAMPPLMAPSEPARLPGHPQLRHGRPGPSRQRDHRVPAEPGDRPDGAGHRSNADNLQGSTLLLNGSDNTLLDAVHRPGPRPHPVRGAGPGQQRPADQLEGAGRAAFAPRTSRNRGPGAGERRDGAERQRPVRPGQGRPVPRGSRAGADQCANDRTSSPANYCQNIVNIQTPFLAANQALLATGQAPVAGVGDNLLTFLANRLLMSFTNLACQNFGLTNPVTVTLNGAGVAVAATFNTTPQQATNTAPPRRPVSVSVTAAAPPADEPSGK